MAHLELKAIYLGPEGCSVRGHIAPMLSVPKVPVMQRHLDGRVDAICYTVNIPGVDSDGPTEAR